MPMLAGSGKIGGTSGRHDSKFFDAIYASDVQDLRMSSRKKPLAEIREEYKRKAIAGEVRGFESVPYTKVMVEPTVIARSFATRVVNFGAIFYGDEGKKVHLYNATDNYVFEGVITTYYQIKLSELSGTNDVQSGDSVYVLIQTEQAHKQANPTWTDIIGDPANIAATFPDGVEGQWIPVIPDGTSKQFDFNRKVIDYSLALMTTDLGATWVNNTGIPPALNTTTNSITSGSVDPVGRVHLMNYETQAHFTEDAVNSEVLDLGGVFATGGVNIDQGCLFISSLVDGIGRTSTTNRLGEVGVTTLGLQQISNKPYLPTSASWSVVSHEVITIGHNFESDAVKALDYLSESNSVLELSYAYKEMVYDSGWGDNSKFEITDNQSTLTDDNGNTVKYGTVSFKTQFFYDGSDI
ncbi:MAG: hypothetical protein P8I94_11595 [Emcibacteraceae bacterium]|nr:hypothetical protein [Emcibacteraceae bacterium]